MTSETIIQQFELQVSDVTELSTSEEYIVLNRVYNKICNLKGWEFLKKTTSGAILQDSGGYYIDAPTDFAYFTSNNNFTSTTLYTDVPRVIFVGSTYEPYEIINWSDRGQYRNRDGYAYFEYATNKIRFTQTPVAMTYEFDYISVPSALVAGSTPIFPARFHEALLYGMAVDDSIIQMSPKATSYAPENQAKYQAVIDDMSLWNANLQIN